MGGVCTAPLAEHQLPRRPCCQPCITRTASRHRSVGGAANHKGPRPTLTTAQHILAVPTLCHDCWRSRAVQAWQSRAAYEWRVAGATTLNTTMCKTARACATSDMPNRHALRAQATQAMHVLCAPQTRHVWAHRVGTRCTCDHMHGARAPHAGGRCVVRVQSARHRCTSGARAVPAYR